MLLVFSAPSCFDTTREMLFFAVNLARSIIGWYFSAMSNIQLAFNFCLLTPSEGVSKKRQRF